MKSIRELPSVKNLRIGIPFLRVDRACADVMNTTSEVGNGGLLQYYSNSSGDGANDLPAALSEIEAKKSAQALQEANSKFGANGPNPDRTKRLKHYRNEIPIPAPGYQWSFGTSWKNKNFLPVSRENLASALLECELSPKMMLFSDNLSLIVKYSRYSYSVE